jgi:hypothetical protein
MNVRNADGSVKYAVTAARGCVPDATAMGMRTIDVVIPQTAVMKVHP